MLARRRDSAVGPCAARPRALIRRRGSSGEIAETAAPSLPLDAHPRRRSRNRANASTDGRPTSRDPAQRQQRRYRHALRLIRPIAGQPGARPRTMSRRNRRRDAPSQLRSTGDGSAGSSCQPTPTGASHRTDRPIDGQQQTDCSRWEFSDQCRRPPLPAAQSSQGRWLIYSAVSDG